LHGDAKLDNLGLRGDRLVAVDWGDLTGTGPAEMDIVWFAALSTLAPKALNGRIAAMPDELFRMYGRHAPRGLNPRSLDLACIGMMAQGGFFLGSLASVPHEGIRVRATQLRDWWQTRLREALETWSPT
jgi:aminoglycoside phosphotransferase (APT) family kinase protein